tara:strand:+ start:489 stop:671 length:183 start_codon:yes stop_codon:yes gene_type:complete
MKIKVGSLVQIQHFGSRYNGKIGIVIYVHKRAGFVDSYAVKIPNTTYEIGVAREQCRVIA